MGKEVWRRHKTIKAEDNKLRSAVQGGDGRKGRGGKLERESKGIHVRRGNGEEERF